MSNEREWRTRILDWEQSGMKMAAWCREHSLKASAMGYWYKKIGKARANDVQFTEIHPKPMAAPPKESNLIIKMRDVQIEITEATNIELLSKVVKAIRTC